MDDDDVLDDIPSDLVARLLAADPDEEGGAYDDVLDEAARRGADVVPELQATLDALPAFHPDDADGLRTLVAEVAVASGAPEALALALRDVAARVDEADRWAALDALLDLEIADEDAWLDVARELREHALRDGDLALRSVSTYVLATAPSGTEGVLAVVLHELSEDPAAGVRAACLHGDERVAPIFLDLLRQCPLADEADDDVREVLCDVAVALHDWGVPLEPTDRVRANAAIDATCAVLEDDIVHLRAQIAANQEAIRELRARGAGSLRPAAESAGARNAPCPCGSGRKRKKCCG